MNTQKQVFKKLYPVKVELGLLQDIQADYDFVNNNFEGLKDKFWDSIETASNLKSLLSKDLDKYSKIEKDIISAKQKLKDLGLENQTKDLENILGKISKNKNDLNRILSVKL